MSKKILFIAQPVYDGRLMGATFISEMTFLMTGSPELEAPPFVDLLLGHSHVDRARNILVNRFLNIRTGDGKPATHILFIDGDIDFKAEHVTMLLERNLPIVSGLYAKKEPGKPQWVVNLHEPEAVPDETGLCEAKYVGTGFVLIAREVFEEMIVADENRQAENKALLQKVDSLLDACESEHLREILSRDTIKYTDDSDQQRGTCYAFFDAGVRDDRFLSEDWMFCRNWLALGGKIYADCRFHVGHTGLANYPLEQPERKPEFGSGV
jgi:hypothetical protein